jgi:5-methylcytosine-specific restriction endonuclease McrA
VAEAGIVGAVSGAEVGRPFERLCTGPCGQWRPLGWYVKNGSGRLRSRCRECLRVKRVRDGAVRRQRLKSAVRERVTQADLNELGDRQGWRCACGCGRVIRYEYHVDHRVPLSRGGVHVRSNLRLLAPVCNLKLGNSMRY